MQIGSVIKADACPSFTKLKDVFSESIINLLFFLSGLPNLNFILFPKESKEFYQLKNKISMNDIIGLQEGFGLYIE